MARKSGSVVARMQKNKVYAPPWYADVPRSSFVPALAGYSILIFGVFGFGAWAATAPIDGAVVAPGVFVATTQNKIIQHLEGGIISDISVKEGERVRAGQTLVKLDPTNASADLLRLKLRRAQLRATDARLTAEAGEKSRIEFPNDLLEKSHDTDVKAALNSETAIFVANRRKLNNEIEILNRSIAAFHQRIDGDKFRLESAKRQQALVEEELVGKTKLLKSGLIRKPEYLAVQRVHANIVGEVGHRKSEIDDARERIKGTHEQIARARSVAISEAVEERKRISGELKDLRERITAAQDVLQRVEIKAPVDGIVVKLEYHTSGGVVRPGTNILSLLPVGDELVIESRIRPQDIDNLRIGQDAIVRLTALNQRVTPMIPARVTYVSADSVPDEQDRLGDNVYVTRVQLDGVEISKLENFLATPGMPAEVYIKTGQRTFFEYLMQPVADTLARAFRES